MGAHIVILGRKAGSPGRGNHLHNEFYDIILYLTGSGHFPLMAHKTHIEVPLAPDLPDPGRADIILSTALIISTSTVTAPRSYNSSATLDGGSLVILQVSRHGRKRLTSYVSSRGPFPDSRASFLPPGTNSPTPSVTDGPNTQVTYSLSQCLRHLPFPLPCHHIRLRCPFVLPNDSVL